MTRSGRVLLLVVAAAVAAGGGALAILVHHGVSARDEPTAIEAWIARGMRRLATPRSQRDAQNAVLQTPEVLARARAHFADHCASCHGNDGHGKTTIGQNLYPKAPDMWLPATQSLSDGELRRFLAGGAEAKASPPEHKH